MEIYDDAFDRRDHIQSLIDQYEEIMDEIDVLGREAKDKVYSKDVFGRGKSLITDVSILTIFWPLMFGPLFQIIYLTSNSDLNLKWKC